MKIQASDQRTASTVADSVLNRWSRPAGMMLGFLLAKAGLSVVVLKKHQDFISDFSRRYHQRYPLELIEAGPVAILPQPFPPTRLTAYGHAGETAVIPPAINSQTRFRLGGLMMWKLFMRRPEQT